MKISTLFYTIRQGFVNIFRNKWYSLASVATISACLFLFGLFYAVVMNFQSIVMKAEEGVSVTVFFHTENDPFCESHEEGMIPTDERIAEIGQMIANRPEVSEVRFTSDEEAWTFREIISAKILMFIQADIWTIPLGGITAMKSF